MYREEIKVRQLYNLHSFEMRKKDNPKGDWYWGLLVIGGLVATIILNHLAS